MRTALWLATLLFASSADARPHSGTRSSSPSRSSTLRSQTPPRLIFTAASTSRARAQSSSSSYARSKTTSASSTRKPTTSTSAVRTTTSKSQTTTSAKRDSHSVWQNCLRNNLAQVKNLCRDFLGVQTVTRTACNAPTNAASVSTRIVVVDSVSVQTVEQDFTVTQVDTIVSDRTIVKTVPSVSVATETSFVDTTVLVKRHRSGRNSLSDDFYWLVRAEPSFVRAVCIALVGQPKKTVTVQQPQSRPQSVSVVTKTSVRPVASTIVKPTTVTVSDTTMQLQDTTVTSVAVVPTITTVTVTRAVPTSERAVFSGIVQAGPAEVSLLCSSRLGVSTTTLTLPTQIKTLMPTVQVETTVVSVESLVIPTTIVRTNVVEETTTVIDVQSSLSTIVQTVVPTTQIVPITVMRRKRADAIDAAFSWLVAFDPDFVDAACLAFIGQPQTVTSSPSAQVTEPVTQVTTITFPSIKVIPTTVELDVDSTTLLTSTITSFDIIPTTVVVNQPRTVTRTISPVTRTTATLSIYTGTTSFVDALTTVIQPIIILTTVARPYQTYTTLPVA